MAQEQGRKSRQSFVVNDRFFRRAWGVCLVALLNLVFLQLPTPTFAAITAAVESPVAGPVTGVQLVRGWAFDTDPGSGIARVDFFVDDSGPFEIPCCGERADVVASFPQYSSTVTLQSGWGLTFNWGILPPGTHTVRVEVRNTQGEVWVSPSRQVEVISLGGFEFVGELSLAHTTVRLEGEDLILEGVLVQDKATGTEQELTLRLRWDANAQTLVVSGATPSGETASLSFQGMLRRFMAPLQTWLARVGSAGSVQAGEGIHAEWESPTDGQVVAGVGVVRAWMFAEEVGTPITEVQLLMDGQPLTTLPCCSARADVKAAFPDNPNAEHSGAGLVVNYGDLGAGPHTLELMITAANGARCSFLRNIIAIQPGGFAFLDLFDLSHATARIEGEELVIENVLVREKASQIQRIVTLRFRWESRTQGFVLVSNSPPEALDQTVQVRKGQAAALTLLATDADGDPLVYEIVDEPRQGRLSGTPPHLTYTPSSGFSGQDQFTFQARDFTSTSNTATVTLALNATNLPPTFTVGPNQTVLEDAGPQTVSGWATGMDDGDPGVTQALTFQVTGNTNPSLFAAGPSVDATTGTLMYTPAPNANGSATMTLVLQDDGGTTGGGRDTSLPRTFTITVTPVNDAPSFTVGPNLTVLEDAGPQTVPGWATGIEDGDPEVAQTLTFQVTGNTNPSLFAAGPSVDATTGTLTYTLAPDANGSATITLALQDNGGTANGGQDTSASQTFTITITPVNDAPSFIAGPDQTVSLSAGSQTIPQWATGISAGPPDEAGQALTFQIAGNTNPGLFSVVPTVSATGTLTYTPASGAVGSATITVVLQDDGGTVGGGQDTSTPQTFTITVMPNTAPTFMPGADQTVLEDAGPQTVSGWATGMDDGDPGVTQTLTFQVTGNTNPNLFAAGPSVDATTGTLTYTPASDANGSATVTLVLQDDGGTAGGGQDTSASQTFVITVIPVNDAPSFTANNPPVATNNGRPVQVTGWATFIPGPTDESGQTVVSYSVSDITNAVMFDALPTVAADGTLIYTPNQAGTSNFTVTVQDNGGTANGGQDTSAPQTFTIEVQ